MANRYWVGGSGNWSDTAHWSTTSGGAGGASLPTSVDDVIFDANSAPGSFSVNMTASFSHLAKSINSTGIIGTVQITKDPALSLPEIKVYGNLTLYNFSHDRNIYIQPRANMVITQTGSTGGNALRVENNWGGTVSIDLASNFTGNKLVMDGYGVLRTNGYTINSGIQIAGTGSGDFTNSTITTASFYAVTTGTLVSTGSTINSTFNSFSGGGKSYNVVNLIGTVQVSGDNLFNTLSITAGCSITFVAGSTQTITNFVANGTSSSQIILRCVTSGSTFTFSKPSGTVDAYYLDLKDSIVTGGATWNARNSLDSGNNSGWAFVGPTVPAAAFTATPLLGRTPVTVTFTDTSLGIPDTWAWTFGDGGTSTLQNPTHTYTTSGIYSVSLYASNSLGGDTETKTSYIASNQTIINPTEISSDEAFSSPSVVPGVTTRPVDSILPDEAFSNVSIAIYVPVGETTSNEAFANPTIITGVKNIFPTEISSDEVFSTNLIISRGLIYVPVLSSGPDETFDAPAIVPGPVTVAGLVDIPTAEAFDSPTLIQSPPPPPPPTDWAAIGKEDDKDYIYRIYQRDGTFIGIWTDVGDVLQFTQSLNTPGTTTTVKLNRSPNTTKEVRAQLSTQVGDHITTEDGYTFAVTYQTNNSVGTGTDVDIDLRVDIEVQYGNFDRLATQNGDELTTELGEYLLAGTGAPNGVRVFSGFIMDYESLYGDSNGVTVTLASNGAELSQQLILSGANTSSTVSSQEIATTFRGILDTNPGRMGYTTDSIINTGVSVPATFQLNTKLEGIQSLITQAPTGYYWYGNVAENRVYLQPANTVADHTWLLGYHIKNMALKRSQEQLRNQVFFVGAEVSGVSIFKRYDDTVSQAAWGIGLHRITDRRYSVTSSIDKRAAKEMSRFTNPVYTTTVDISSARYNLESIKLGQMVGFGNTDNFLKDLLLQIVSLTYTPTSVSVQLGEILDTQANIIDDVESNLQNEQYQTLPNAPS